MTRILIVEDVPDNVELARKILTSRGYEVIHAINAEMGYNLAIQERPDLVLLDLGLPDYDGLTLAGQIRENPTFERLPIIAFTAWPQETDKARKGWRRIRRMLGKNIVKQEYTEE